MSVRDERAMKVLILSQFLTGSISIINYFVSSYLLRVVNRCGTVHNCIVNVSSSLAALGNEFIKFPTSIKDIT